MKTIDKLIILVITGILLLPIGRVLSQVDSAGRWDGAMEDWESQIGNLEETDHLTEELLEQMEDVRENARPNLNDLNYETAINKLQLTDYQYYQLQLYIEVYGPLYSIYEIPCIDGFTDEDMKRLAERTSIAPPPKPRPSFRELVRSCKNVFWVRYGQVVEQQAGYDTTRENHFDGSPAHVQFRYDFSLGKHFGLRIAGEKDAGEAFFRGKQKQGFDHYSGSAYVKDIGWLKSAVLGDYRLNFGQGLVLGSSMMSGRGAGISAVRRFSGGIRPVATTNESQLFRGGAFTLGNTRWSGSAFAGAVTESNLTAFGGVASYRNARFSISAQAVCYGEFSDSASAKEKWKSLVMPKKVNAGLSYHALAGRTLLFGEFALNEKGKPAALQAALFPIVPVFQLATLLRYYASGYQSPMGNGFRASSGDCGEFGAYLTGHLVLGRQLEADLFCDYYRLHWLSYLTDTPVQGMDAGVSLSCQVSRQNQLYFRYQWKTKPKNESDDIHLHRLTEQCRHRFRFQWTSTPLPFLSTKTEASFVLNKESAQDSRWYKGILMYQDLAFDFKKPQIAVHLRVAYFDTDRYDERLYAYENDVYYTFTIGSYYYQGLKAYLVLRYKIQNLSVWFRISRTHYLNKESVSSGLTLIEKPHKTEVRVQCLYRF